MRLSRELKNKIFDYLFKNERIKKYINIFEFNIVFKIKIIKNKLKIYFQK